MPFISVILEEEPIISEVVIFEERMSFEFHFLEVHEEVSTGVRY